MIKRIALAALMLIMVPVFAFAGSYGISVAGGASAGTVTPTPLSGYASATKTFIITAGAGNTLNAVKLNNADVTGNSAYVNGTGPGLWSLTVPLSGSSQTFSISFKQAPAAIMPTLVASLPPAISMPPATATLISGASSTISGLAGTTATFTFSAPVGSGVTFSPTSAVVTDPINISTYVTAANAGTYTVTLTLTGVNGTSSTTTTSITVQAIANYACTQCHGSSPQAIAYATSIHAQGGANSTCQACHNPSGTKQHPFDVKVATVNPATFVTLRNISTTTGYVATGQVFCTVCHKAPYAIPHPTNLNAGVTCAKCHTDPLGQNTGTGDAHSIQPLPRCIDCHAVQQAQVAPGLVNDNSGVRSITQEFAKWSHHVTGVTLNDAHCAACHLEGKVSGTEIAVDSTKHMVDGMVHLRNADTDADMQWDPASPNHTTMDNFCMSCHDANGATSAMSVNIQAFINTNGIAATGKTASAKNPFGDTISNRYDKMQRPGVTNVGDQFNTSNNSHHGVKGPRYSGRTRVAGSRAIANPGTFANNSSATLQGVRSTIYDAGNFNQLYTPLANNGGETAPRTGAATLGDDSTLHCGDCHTVGQWKAGSSTIASGAPTPVAIGAHGSNNEYLLRNSIGTDQRHTQNAYTVSGTNVVTQTNPNGAFLVCYNCHAYKNYGSTYVGTGANAGNIAGAELANNQPHAGEYDTGGRCNAPGNTLSFAGYTTGAATDGSQFASRIDGLGAKLTGEQAPDGNVSGNIFGIQCLNCHNSGIGNAYGGIHGSANDTSWNGVTPASLDGNATGGYYINGMGNATKVERFLPGLGNAMHVPGTLGGITGGTTVPSGTNGVAYSFTTGGVTNDTNWEQKHWQQTATTVINFKTAVVTNTASAGAGCYTLGGTTPIATNVSAGLSGPSVTGEGGSATAASDTWGGCEDHSAAQGGGNHGFLKRIVRPVTY